MIRNALVSTAWSQERWEAIAPAQRGEQSSIRLMTEAFYVVRSSDVPRKDFARRRMPSRRPDLASKIVGFPIQWRSMKMFKFQINWMRNFRNLTWRWLWPQNKSASQLRLSLQLGKVSWRSVLNCDLLEIVKQTNKDRTGWKQPLLPLTKRFASISFKEHHFYCEHNS